LNVNNSRQVHWGSDKVVNQSEYSGRSGTSQKGPSREDEEEEEPEVSAEGITLAVTLLRGKLGCAYYDQNDNKIYFLEDQPDSNEFDLANLGSSR
jgi:DNA mismatch repair protein MSH5